MFHLTTPEGHVAKHKLHMSGASQVPLLLVAVPAAFRCHYAAAVETSTAPFAMYTTHMPFYLKIVIRSTASRIPCIVYLDGSCTAAGGYLVTS